MSKSKRQDVVEKLHDIAATQRQTQFEILKQQEHGRASRAADQKALQLEMHRMNIESQERLLRIKLEHELKVAQMMQRPVANQGHANMSQDQYIIPSGSTGLANSLPSNYFSPTLPNLSGGVISNNGLIASNLNSSVPSFFNSLDSAPNV